MVWGSLGSTPTAHLLGGLSKVQFLPLRNGGNDKGCDSFVEQKKQDSSQVEWRSPMGLFPPVPPSPPTHALPSKSHGTN